MAAFVLLHFTQKEFSMALDRTRRMFLFDALTTGFGVLLTACEGRTNPTATAPVDRITLTASPSSGQAPLTVEFLEMFPAGIGTGCEAVLYTFGDGEIADLYTPCVSIIPSPVPNTTPPPFVPPTDPPRARAALSRYSHTYARPGIYMASFVLREKPSNAVTHTSNTVAITVL